MLKKIFSTIVFAVLLSVVTLFGRVEILFSPDDRPAEKLVTLLDDAKKEVLVAIYMLTEPRIVKAIVNAKGRGLNVEVVTDKISTEGTFGKIETVAKGNVPVFVFAPEIYASRHSGKKLSTPGIMHNKFAVIDDQVWTGSFNWTYSANWKNQENVIITDDKKAVARYRDHFKILKTRCVPYEKTPLTNKEQSQLTRFLNLLREKLAH